MGASGGGLGGGGGGACGAAKYPRNTGPCGDGPLEELTRTTPSARQASGMQWLLGTTPSAQQASEMQGFLGTTPSTIQLHTVTPKNVEHMFVIQLSPAHRVASLLAPLTMART